MLRQRLATLPSLESGMISFATSQYRMRLHFSPPGVASAVELRLLT